MGDNCHQKTPEEARTQDRWTVWLNSEVTPSVALGGKGWSRGPVQVDTEVCWQEVEVVLVCRLLFFSAQ